MKLKTGSLENKKKPIIDNRQGDGRSPDSKLKSGKSISFSVPRNHLASNLKIRVDFTYDWEYGVDANSSPYSEPRHSIFFSSLDLKRFMEEKKAF